jgi:hypothetical protein
LVKYFSKPPFWDFKSEDEKEKKNLFQNKNAFHSLSISTQTKELNHNNLTAKMSKQYLLHTKLENLLFWWSWKMATMSSRP